MSGVAGTGSRRGDRRRWLLAILLAMLAGYVDAIGFLTISGFFVSFMSGNTTRMAVAAAGPHPTALPLAVIGSFVLGVVLASLLAERAGMRRKPAVLALVAILLAGAALARPHATATATAIALLLAMAMGAENGTFQRDGEVSIGVTYMTGTLVKLGQRIAAALVGGARWGWLPFLMLWTGLATGAWLGAHAYPYGWSLWLAAGAAAMLAAFAATIVPASEHGQG